MCETDKNTSFVQGGVVFFQIVEFIAFDLFWTHAAESGGMLMRCPYVGLQMNLSSCSL